MKKLLEVIRFVWAERKGIQNPDFKKHEVEFMPAELELIHSPPSPLPLVLGWSIIVIALFSVVWSWFGKVDIVATAGGKIVSVGHTKIIQSSSTATVKSILVHDGDRVSKGQPLIELDSQELDADKQRYQEQWAQARLSQIRAEALLRSLDTGAEVALSKDERLSQEAFDREVRTAKSQLGEYKARLTAIDAQIAQRQASLRENISEITKLKETLPIVLQREADFKKLAADKYVSEHQAQDRTNQRIQVAGDLEIAKQRTGEIEAQIREVKSQRDTTSAEFKVKLAKEASDSAAVCAQMDKELMKSQAQIGKTILTAPVDGVVQQLSAHTLGGVVTPGQAVMQIVPVGEDVIIEAWVENKDIGFIHPNQKAEIKVETFEHTKYGTIPGKVMTVSSDAVQDEKKGLGYIARIKLDRSYMSIGDRKVNMSPGLSVTSEINIGTKRILEYVLSPMLEAAASAVPR
jgi:hemolysin D